MSKKFRCINNDEMDGILTKGREYAGEYAKHRDLVTIFRCDDKNKGHFSGKRFEEVKEEEYAEPIVSIYTYSLDYQGKGK